MTALARSPLVDLMGKRLRVLDGAGMGHVMGEGEVVAICFAPTLTLKHDDGTYSHHSSSLPHEPVVDSPPATCSQCGQRTPVCVEFGDSIIFVPRSGFGSEGEWRHVAPPKVQVGPHMPRPKVFVS